jgi:hypothetical protein
VLVNRSSRLASFFFLSNRSSRVVDHLLTSVGAAQRLGVVYVYLDYNDQAHQTAADVMKSLLKQLVYQRRSLPTKLESAYDQRKSLDMNAVLDMFLESAEHFSNVFVVLDALDECNKHEREVLMPYLQRFLQSRIRIFLTARPEVYCQLSSNKQRNLEISAQEHDIKNFLVERLKQTESTLTDQFKASIIRTVLSRAKGMYAILLCCTFLAHFC